MDDTGRKADQHVLDVVTDAYTHTTHIMLSVIIMLSALLLAGQAAEIDGVYNRLKSCPVPSMPVYGMNPIFTCGGTTTSCGCGSVA